MGAGDTDIHPVIAHSDMAMYPPTRSHIQTHTHGDTDPVGSCHLHNDLNSCPIKEASISPHHHRWTLAVT